LTLSLVPEPAHIQLASGSYTLDGPATILLSAHAERGEWVAAEQLKAALASRDIVSSIQPRSAPTTTHGDILLAVAGRDNAIFSEIQSSPESDAEPASHAAYRLIIQPDQILVAGASPAGLAHGARTLMQLIITAAEIPCLTIEDAPTLPWRGVMLDISRGKVPTLATLYSIVDVIASFKLNMLQLYMENTFSFHSHPHIGAGWGAMTAEEVVALDLYCRERYVELVPCFQSLGHHRRLLALPEYAHLSYSAEEWTLTPREETWSLLEELYDDLLPCFSSTYVNVCCDEPFDLTHTTPLTYEAAIGLATGSEITAPTSQTDAFIHGTRLYLTHVQRLHEMLHARGRTMMIWDDIFQQMPAMLTELPPDVIYLCWYYEAADEYLNSETIRRAGRQSMVCPGTSSWNTLFTRMENARANIRGFVRSGLQAGSIGVLTTDWGDNGHPNLLAASWYGYVYSASEAWTPERLPDDEFDHRFALLFFGAEEAGAALEAMRLMSAACTLPGVNKMNGSCTRAMFFRDPITDDFASIVPDDSIEQMEYTGTHALDLLIPLHGIDAERVQTVAEMRFTARQIVHAARKTRAGRQLATVSHTDHQSRRHLYDELTALKHELHVLRWEYQRLWLARNHPDGIWLTLDQFDTAAQVLDRWRAQVAPHFTHSQ
jgi:hexosaminidase